MHCNVSGTNYSVAHGGVSYTKKQMATTEHRKALDNFPLVGYFQSTPQHQISQQFDCRLAVEHTSLRLLAINTHYTLVMLPDNMSAKALV